MNRIINILIIFILLGSSNFIFSQNYVKAFENLEKYYGGADFKKNHVFTMNKTGANYDPLTIDVYLEKATFAQGATSYGYDSDNPIPDGWTAEIISVNNGATINDAKTAFTFTGNPIANIQVNLKVMSGGSVVSGLENVVFQYRVEGPFTAISVKYNSCSGGQEFVLYEVSIGSERPCAGTDEDPKYNIKIFNAGADMDTASPVNDLDGNPANKTQKSNKFLFSLAKGDYSYKAEDGCGRSFTGTFTILEAYDIGAKVKYAGFECAADANGTAVLTIEGAERPLTWKLEKKNGDTFNELYNQGNGGANVTSSSDVSGTGSGNFTITIKNLEQATYKFSFIDSNGCDKEQEFEVITPPAMAHELVDNDTETLQALLCSASVNGSFTFRGYGGWTSPFVGNVYRNDNENAETLWPAVGYTFTLLKSDGATPPTYSSVGEVESRKFVPWAQAEDGSQNGFFAEFDGLGPGSYILKMYEQFNENSEEGNIYSCTSYFDMNGMISGPGSATAPYQITVPAPLVVVEDEHIDISCFGQNDGEIKVSTSGGTPDYTYVWKRTVDGVLDGDFVNPGTEDLTGLAKGIYELTVTDANGCDASLAAIEIIEPSQLAAELDTTVDTVINCFDNFGVIKVDVTVPSTPPFTYRIVGANYLSNDGSNNVNTLTEEKNDLTHSFSVKAGTYKVTVTDSRGCDVETAERILTQPASGLEVTGTVSADFDGTENGGTAFENGDGIHMTCNGGSNGAIDITVSGSTAPYTYSWTAISGDASKLSANSDDQTGLEAGVYQVEVTDSKGCSVQRIFVISDPAPLTVPENDMLDADKPNYTYLGEFETSKYYLSPNEMTYMEARDIAASLGGYLVTVKKEEENQWLIDNATITRFWLGLDDIANESQFVWNDGTPLDWGNFGSGEPNDSGKNNIKSNPGQDYIWFNNGVWDDINPSLKFRFIIEFNPTQIKDFNGNSIDCNGQQTGEIDFTVTGGTKPYTYAWTKKFLNDAVDDTFAEATENITGLGAGKYTIIVTDASGCTATKTYTLTEPDELLASFDTNISSEIGCYGEDGSLKVDITQESTSPYTYTLTGTNYLDEAINIVEENQTVLTKTYENLKAAKINTKYKVEIKDANGCTIEFERVLIQPDKELEITAELGNIGGGDTDFKTITCYGDNDATIDVEVDGGSIGLVGYGSMNDGLYKTLNGGITWQKINDVQHTHTNFYSNQIGYSVKTSDNKTYKTTDGGVNWTLINHGLSDITFVSESVGYAHDSLSTLKTIDGGQSWTVVNSVDYHDLSFIDEKIGFGRISVGIEKGLWKTIDGGINWVKVNEIAYTELEFTSELIGYARSSKTPGSPLEAGDTCQCEDGTYKTVDGGLTWSKKSSKVFTFMSFVNENIGYGKEWPIGGGEGGLLYKTVDGGDNWNLINSDLDSNNENYSSLSFPNSKSTYTYSWTTEDGSGLDPTAQDQTGLGPGTYKLVVTDSNGCFKTITRQVTEPDALSITENIYVKNGFNITCFGDNDGKIDIDVIGGTGVYTYQWTKSTNADFTDGDEVAYSTDKNIADLGPGWYSITVTDSNGCTKTPVDPFEIKEPPEIVLSFSTKNFNGFDVSCNGAVDGEIILTVDGGVPDYTYSWERYVGGIKGVGVKDDDFSANTKDLANIEAGAYYVTVTDANLCPKVSDALVIEEPPEIRYTLELSNFNGKNISCFGFDDGEIKIDVSGGFLSPGETYKYEWRKDDINSAIISTEKDLNGLVAGNYWVTITDSAGCSKTNDIDDPIEIKEYDKLEYEGITSDYNKFEVSVKGNSDGFINITPKGGTGDYLYDWKREELDGTLDNTFSASTQNLEGLKIGKYTLTITDSNGCTRTNEAFILEEPNELLIDLGDEPTNILCYGEKTGDFKAIITQGSVPTYKYILNGKDYDSLPVTETVSSIKELNYNFKVKAGEYSITVVDLNGGTKTSAKRKFTQPDAPLKIVGEVSKFNNNNFNISCNGASDAFIKLTVTGGTISGTDYDYTWSTTNGTNLDLKSKDQSKLGPGDYTVIVEDENGCTTQDTFTIIEPKLIEYKLELKKDITCFGQNDGSIDITVAEGTGIYDYTWSTEDGAGIVDPKSQDQSGLSKGTYKLILKDGCETLQYIYEIEEPDVLKIDLDEKVDILCFGEKTGVLKVTVSGGTSPYTYEWEDNFGNKYNRDIGNVFNKGDLSNIPAGTYDLKVTDNNGCETTLEDIKVEQPDELKIDYTAVDVSCFNGNDGTINVAPSGGVAPYTYSWSDLGNGSSRTNLESGKYTVTVTDNNNCVKSVEIEIKSAPQFNLTADVTPITCFGANDGSIKLTVDGGQAPITLEWADDPNAGISRTNLKSGVYSVLLTDSSGCEINEIYTITEPAKLQLSAITSDALDCDNPNSGSIDLQVVGGNPPYTYVWSSGETTEDIKDLSANNYTVSVTDSKGCKAEQTFSVVRPFDITVDLSTDLRVVCETRDVYQVSKVKIDGGVLPYTIKWSSGDVSGANGEIMETNKEGSYSVEITDDNGCSKTVLFDVTLPKLGYPEFDYTSFYWETFDALTFNDPITFTNNSTENYLSVSWDFGDGNTSSDNDPVHTYEKKGSYDVTLYVTYLSGCIYEIKKTIYVGDSYEIELPNAFTPNADGLNDTFRPVYYGFKTVDLKVFDTWGTLIYSETADGAKMTGWNGTLNNKPATNGNYIYQVTGEAYNGETIIKNGPFTLLR